MEKIPQGVYTREFREQAVKRAHGDIVFRTILKPPRGWSTALFKGCRKTSVLRHVGVGFIHMAASDTTTCSTPTWIR